MPSGRRSCFGRSIRRIALLAARGCGSGAGAPRAGAAGLSGAHHRDGGAVPGRRADRHHRAHRRGRRCSSRSDQNVIIDNRGGAGGNLGIAYVARANPDGYTLLFTSTAIAVNPGLFANLPYDPIKDFAPISEIVNAPNVLFVRPDSGITSIADLVAKAKAEPNKFNYASPGVGTKSHLTGELFKLRAGINIQHIPYRGGGPATQALVAGTGAACLGGARAGRAADQEPARCARSRSPARSAGIRCRTFRP